MIRTVPAPAGEATGGEGLPAAERDSLLPVSVAAARLGFRGTQTLKKGLRSGRLPSFRRDAHWLVPESFVRMVIYSCQMGQPGNLDAVAARWFTLARDRLAAAEAAAQAPAEPMAA